LSNFTGTTYRNVSRSYLEFQQFYESIVLSNPQTIIPALPLAQTSAPTDEEDDRLVRIMLQRWITRVCEDAIIIHDEDLRSFIESDFGFQPTPKPRKRASSGFSLMRRNVPDEDEELQKARFELTKLEGQFFETAKAVDKVSAARKSGLSFFVNETSLILINMSQRWPPHILKWATNSSALQRPRRILLLGTLYASWDALGTVWLILTRLKRSVNASYWAILLDTKG
jgi:hypothetical protein